MLNKVTILGKTTGYIFAGTVFASYVTLNVLFSQWIDPLYFDYVEEKEPAVVQTLEKLQTIPEFPQVLAVQKNIFGENLKDKVVAPQLQQKQRISQLEKLLERNPSARDVLWNVSRLEQMSDNPDKAKEYADRAKAVDPTL
ncbi:hypothetical protein HGA88_00025 [Candidatus Roizmanbacteria bacterium]|nr:hypothetical protein [Candidatus Roizmanbacteria bacterium]